VSSSSADGELRPGTWTLDPATTSLGFRAKLFLGLKAQGHFRRYDATINVGASAADSSVAVTIYTDSVDTGIKMRDGHLRDDNVFDTARFPTIAFHSTAVTETPTGLDVAGNLQVRDVARPITFHATRVSGSSAPRYTASLRVTPKDYGITRPGTTKPLDLLIDATLRQD
jgi:polyisoprenoid-binding protein YceI